jgi:hypothetical protein
VDIADIDSKDIENQVGNFAIGALLQNIQYIGLSGDVNYRTFQNNNDVQTLAEDTAISLLLH